MSGIYDYLKESSVKGNIIKNIMAINGEDSGIIDKVNSLLEKELYSYRSTVKGSSYYSSELEIFKDKYDLVKDELSDIENSSLPFTEKSEKLFELLKKHNIADYRLKPFINDIIKKYVIKATFTRLDLPDKEGKASLEPHIKKFNDSLLKTSKLDKKIFKKYKKEFNAIFIKYGAIDLNNTLSYEINNILRLISKKENIDLKDLKENQKDIEDLFKNTIIDNPIISEKLVVDTLNINSTNIAKMKSTTNSIHKSKPLADLLGLLSKVDSKIDIARGEDFKLDKQESNEVSNSYIADKSEDSLFNDALSVKISISKNEEVMFDIKEAIRSSFHKFTKVSKEESGKIFKDLTLLNLYEDIDIDSIDSDTIEYIKYLYNVGEVFRDNKYIKFSVDPNIVRSFKSISDIANNLGLNNIDLDMQIDIKKNIKPIVNRFLDRDVVTMPTNYNKKYDVLEFLDFLTENRDSVRELNDDKLNKEYDAALVKRSINRDFLDESSKKPAITSLKLKELLPNNNILDLLELKRYNFKEYSESIENIKSLIKDRISNLSDIEAKEDRVLNKIVESLEGLTVDLDKSIDRSTTNSQLSEKLAKFISNIGEYSYDDIIDSVDGFRDSVEGDGSGFKSKDIFISNEKDLLRTTSNKLSSLIGRVPDSLEKNNISKLIDMLTLDGDDRFNSLKDFIKLNPNLLNESELDKNNFRSNIHSIIRNMKDEADSTILFNALIDIDLSFNSEKVKPLNEKSLATSNLFKDIFKHIKSSYGELKSNIFKDDLVKLVDIIKLKKLYKESTIAIDDDKIRLLVNSLYKISNDSELFRYKDSSKLLDYITENYLDKIDVDEKLSINYKKDRLVELRELLFDAIEVDKDTTFSFKFFKASKIFTTDDKIELMNILKDDYDKSYNTSIDSKSLLLAVDEVIKDNNLTVTYSDLDIKRSLVTKIESSFNSIAIDSEEKLLNDLNVILSRLELDGAYRVGGLFTVRNKVVSNLEFLNLDILDVLDKSSFRYLKEESKDIVKNLSPYLSNEKSFGDISPFYNNNLLIDTLIKSKDYESLNIINSTKFYKEELTNGTVGDAKLKIDSKYKKDLNQLDLKNLIFVKTNINLDSISDFSDFRVPTTKKMEIINNNYIEVANSITHKIDNTTNKLNIPLSIHLMQNRDLNLNSNIKYFNYNEFSKTNITDNNRDVIVAEYLRLSDSDTKVEIKNRLVGLPSKSDDNLPFNLVNTQLSNESLDYYNILKLCNKDLEGGYKDDINSYKDLLQNSIILDKLVDTIIDSESILIRNGTKEKYHSTISSLINNDSLIELKSFVEESKEDLYFTFNMGANKEDSYALTTHDADLDLSYQNIDTTIIDTILKEKKDVDLSFIKENEVYANSLSSQAYSGFNDSKVTKYDQKLLDSDDFKNLLKIVIVNQFLNIPFNDVILTEPQILEKMDSIIEQSREVVEVKEFKLEEVKQKIKNFKETELAIKSDFTKLLEDYNFRDKITEDRISNLYKPSNNISKITFDYLKSSKNLINKVVVDKQVTIINKDDFNEASVKPYIIVKNDKPTVSILSKSDNNYNLYQSDVNEVKRINPNFIVNELNLKGKDTIYNSLKDYQNSIAIDYKSKQISLHNFKEELSLDLKTYDKLKSKLNESHNLNNKEDYK